MGSHGPAQGWGGGFGDPRGYRGLQPLLPHRGTARLGIAVPSSGTPMPIPVPSRAGGPQCPHHGHGGWETSAEAQPSQSFILGPQFLPF